MNTTLFAIQIAIAAVAGVVATVLLQDRLEQSVFAVLGRIWGGWRRGTRGIEGYWYSVFWYRGIDGSTHPIASILRIRRIGQRVSMTTESGEGASYQASGSISLGRYVTSTWRNHAGASIYNGACQFIRSPEGDVLAGSWVGWNKDQHVSMGPWVMVFVGKTRDSLMFNRLLQKTAVDSINTTDETTARVMSVVKKMEDAVTRHTETYRDADWNDALAHIRGEGKV